VTSAPALMQGVARVISGDHDGGDAALEDAASVAEKVGADEDLALALCERALVAFERGEWDRAEIVANQAHAALRRARREESYAAPLVAAAQARAVLHRGDLAAVRQHLVSAQRLRPLLTYALPHLAIQARIELARVYVALADLPGARTLMREIDDLLRRRPEMGTLVGQAGTLRAQLSKAAW
jgi:LuxR family transcriptional regulator, maltose regulon positive regulatory protein